MSENIDLSELNIPEHVAIILDGNGRWAKSKHMPRTYGHTVGSKVVERTVEDASDIGIKYLTVYVFSTENWKRSQNEVSMLFSLIERYLRSLIKKSKKNNVRCKVIGRRDNMSSSMLQVIDRLEEETKENTGLTFTLAINYGGRDEITRAVQSIAQDVKNGELNVEDITESTISDYLDTSGIPDPDLLIRTGGDERLSNYLPWQLTYTEFYFTPVLWPAFTKNDLIDAVIKYNGRDRRFGGVK
ncbi:MAG: isoprenyl transferase [Lachnospiraceae bacterium]|nr:isoprenyl transferase [Lachnospiraceae bacterium]